MPINSQRSIKEWSIVYKNTTQSNNTTAFQAVNDLILTNLQSWVYMIDATILYSTAATTTWIRLTVSWTPILNSIIWVTWPRTWAAVLDRIWNQSTDPWVFTQAPYTSQNIAIVKSKVELSWTWNINIQFASEIAWSAITILEWSTMEIQKIW